MKKVLLWVVLVLAVAVAAVAGVVGYRMWYDHKAPNFTGPVELYVYPDMEPSEVRDSIVASGKVKKVASPSSKWW